MKLFSPGIRGGDDDYLLSRERVKLNENEIVGLLFNFIQSSAKSTSIHYIRHYGIS